MKTHFDKGHELVVACNNYYNTHKQGDIGIIMDFMWDYPNWEYEIKFNDGTIERFWDTDVESTTGQILDNSEFRKEFQSQCRDGQYGYSD